GQGPRRELWGEMGSLFAFVVPDVVVGRALPVHEPRLPAHGHAGARTVAPTALADDAAAIGAARREATSGSTRSLQVRIGSLARWRRTGRVRRAGRTERSARRGLRRRRGVPRPWTPRLRHRRMR